MGIEAGDIGIVLQGVGSLAQAAAIFVAACFASNTYSSWRKQRLSERKIEQAERILSATYNERRALEIIRNPLVAPWEISAASDSFQDSADDLKSLSEPEKKRLRLYNAYANRFNGTLEQRKAIESCLPMARALFGEDLERALEDLNRQFHFFFVAIDEGYDDSGRDPDFTKIIRSTLSSSKSTGSPNEMNETISKLVEEVEMKLLPVLRLDASI
jgi:hypothetical protein